jgi:hypothetical protein
VSNAHSAAKYSRTRL